MPIRFRCAYCNQLMAIAHRKAGTVVRCPTCAGQVVVPVAGQAASQGAAPQAPAPRPAAPPKKGEAPPGPALFEHSDFDQVFKYPPAAPAAPGFALGPEPVPAGGSFDIEAVPLPG